MTTDFKCPKCRKIVKVGRLHASYTCPKCGEGMLISYEEKMLGHKIFKKRFIDNKPRVKKFSKSV